MGLKGVELQIAIPKTFDAGKVVEQHQQNVVHQQLHANEALKKEIERKRLTVSDTEETDKVSHEEKDEYDERRFDYNKKGQKEEKRKNEQHPFKGNFIDYSG